MTFINNPRKVKKTKKNIYIIKTAANFIKQDIRDILQTRVTYPTVDDLTADSALNYLPSSLQDMLSIITCGKDTTKVASIGQSLMQSSCPRILLAPLQIGLGVQMQNVFQSNFFVDCLNHNGFSCSYS